MITPFDIYLIGISDNASQIFGIGAIISIILCIIIGLAQIGAFVESVDEFKAPLKKTFDRCFWSVLIFGFLSAIIPSSKTLAAMYVIPPIVKAVNGNKQIQQIPQAVVDLIKSYERKDANKSETEDS
jgi:hypothetical protein